MVKIKYWQMRNKAASLLDSKDYNGAISLSDELIELKINNNFMYGALLIKGSALSHLGKHEESIKIFKKILVLIDENKTEFRNESGSKCVAYGFLGRNYESLYNFEKAFYFYRLMQKTDNKGFAGLMDETKLLIKIKEYSKAIVNFNKIVSITEKWPNSEHWMNEVNELIKKVPHGELKESSKYFDFKKANEEKN